MSDEQHLDDGPDRQAVERLLEQLDRGSAPEAPEGGPEARRSREYLELLGLLGAAVEPIEPPARVKESLLSRLPGSGTPAVAPPAEELPPPVEAPPSRRWALPLAACLALLLAGFSGYQAVQLSGQRQTIERLSQRLEEVEARTPTVAAMRTRLADMEERMALITGRGVEICALRPMAPESRLADSRGVLYVAPDHQHWYLTIEDLKPCKQGRSYQLWFVSAEGEPVSAGIFDVGDGVRVELSSDRMPPKTRAVTVTLEPAGGSQRPTGPAVLHGDEVMAVL